MKIAVFGLVNSVEQAQKIVDRLQAAGFSNDEISIVLPDTSRRESGITDYETYEDQPLRKKGTVVHERHTKAPEGGVTGATAGGVIGGSIGLLAGLGALAIPGLGPFIAAGPIMAALSGTAIGGGLGLLIGSLVGMGIPEYEAKRYHESLKAGNCLISVHTDNAEEINRAQAILKKEGVKDISTTREKIAR